MRHDKELVMWAMLSAIAEWLKKYESVAVWIEGIALVFIFWLDWRERLSAQADRNEQENERRLQHTETSAQIEIWRRQIHADSVKQIWKALRNFEYFVVHSGKVAVGQQFSEDDPEHTYSAYGFKVFQPYLDLQEAYYLSRLVSEPLFEYMKQRMADAESLQRAPDSNTLQNRIQEFQKNWDVYEMAVKLRELS